jgi:hypothetical protein
MSQFEEFDPKDPLASEYFEFVWELPPGVTIETVFWDTPYVPANNADAPLTLDDTQNNDAVTVAKLGGGVYGRYHFRAIILRSDGETSVRSGQFDVEDT